MKITTLLLMSLISSVLFTSCKKDEIPSIIESNDPIYKVSGTIGNENIAWNAGDKNFFMHTSSLKENEILKFIGNISNSTSSFELKYSQANIDKPSYPTFSTNVSSPIYQAINTVLFSYSLDDFSNSARILSVEWFVNGNFYSTDDIEINTPGKYEVCASVSYIGGEVKTLCNDVILGYKKNTVSELLHLVGLDGKVRAWIDSDTEISSITWFVDGIKTSNSLELNTVVTNTDVEITALVLFENGVERTKRILANANQTGKYIQDFSFNENISSLENDFSTNITIVHNGEEYSSNIIENETTNVNYFTFDGNNVNSQGIETRKIVGTFNCKLKKLSDGSIVDGWGQLTTPYGSFETIRLHHTINETDSFYVSFGGAGNWIGLPVPVSHIYEWWGKDEGVPLLTITTQEVGGNQTTSEARYKDNAQEGLGLTEDNLNAVKLFPNPTVNSIEIKSELEIKNCIIYAVNGEVVLNSTLNSIDVSSLQTGNYRIEILLENEERISKVFSKQ